MGDSADGVQHDYSVEAEKSFAAYRIRSKGGHDQLLSPPFTFLFVVFERSAVFVIFAMFAPFVLFCFV